MRLTRQQKDAVRCEEDLMLTACPGSGKTRVIISKLSRIINDVRYSPRSIACITYTNTAVYEIEARLRYHTQPDDENYYDICTIHSFCLNHIFRPFCHLIKGYEKGFKVLTPECAEFEEFAKKASAKYNRHNLNYRELEEFTQLRVDVGGRPVGNPIDHGSLTQEIALTYWELIRKSGFVDFANILFYSFLLLRKRLEILSYVSAKFAWILIDEFQDTTDLQVEILTLIADSRRTRFLLVGDPYQSIYRFTGARPDLADEFAEHIGARTDIQLSGNFRSSSQIISHANMLYSRTPPMQATGSRNKNRISPEPEWQHGNSTYEVITDHFLPALEGLNIPIGDAAILAPTWYTLFPLGRRLREYGIAIVGPGARPYRRNRLFAPLAEHVCAFLVESNPDSIVGIERTLFNTLLNATGRTYYNIFSYRGRVVVFRLLDAARELHQDHMGGISWLESAAREFSQILIRDEYLTDDEADLFAMSVEEMKADMRNNKIDLDNLVITDLGIYASPDAALKLSTIHNAKGREYRAVAMTDLHEGRIPHYQATRPEEIEDAKRLFYVGVTRAEQFLLYVTDKSSHRNYPSQFLMKGSGVGVC